MKWMLVVLVGGMTPVQTDVIFEKLSDCLAAEEQLRKAYTDALVAWDKQAAMTFERRRDYVRARDLQARKLDNSGTCIPHTGGGQPIASSKVSDSQHPPRQRHRQSRRDKLDKPMNEREIIHTVLEAGAAPSKPVSFHRGRAR